jgi:hypothetical protein
MDSVEVSKAHSPSVNVAEVNPASNHMHESFLQRWAQKLGRKPQSADNRAVQVFVGAFGKHPAWDDHVPDLGLAHPILVDFKRAMYEGITGNVDNGQWDKIQQAKKSIPFGHSLLYRFSGGAILGRMWHSQDGKGRQAYPMVAALLWLGGPSDEAFREILVHLPRVQMQCEQAKTVVEVKQAMESLQGFAAERAGRPPPVAPTTIHQSNTISRLIDNAQLGPQHQGLLRALYHLERELSIKLSPSDKPLKANTDSGHAASLRVPPCAKSPTQASRIWIKFLDSHLGLPGPLIAMAPDHGRWIDLIVGQLGIAELYCLRASIEAVPFTSEIPYSLDPEFIERGERLLSHCKAARPF